MVDQGSDRSHVRRRTDLLLSRAPFRAEGSDRARGVRRERVHARRRIRQAHDGGVDRRAGPGARRDDGARQDIRRRRGDPPRGREQQRSLGAGPRLYHRRSHGAPRRDPSRAVRRRPVSAGVTLRSASPADLPVILQLIRGLAEYEKLSHECVATEDALRRTLFGARPQAEVVLAFADDRAAGFALFFHNYSTFLARQGIYLEDLFVFPEFRGRGIGKRLLAHLAQLAVERDCGRLEWSVLDWNADAIRFYESLGAKAMDEWTVYRVTGEALGRLAGAN